MKQALTFVGLMASCICFGQVENDSLPPKVKHAEPLYIDLIRDLGAHKGEREWNLGMGMTDELDYDHYELLVEYEWAPVNRLGLEIETPFLFYSGNEGEVPAGKMEGLQMAAQWSFLVDPESNISLALGYLNLLAFSDFDHFGDPLIEGNEYSPFLVAAKRWGSQFHTLIYTGPVFDQTFGESEIEYQYDIHTSVHYMINGSSNFFGVEFNKSIDHGDFDMVIRPQMRLSIAHDFILGIVTGIPISKEEERLSSFLRLIWEP